MTTGRRCIECGGPLPAERPGPLVCSQVCRLAVEMAARRTNRALVRLERELAELRRTLHLPPGAPPGEFGAWHVQALTAEIDAARLRLRELLAAITEDPGQRMRGAA